MTNTHTHTYEVYEKHNLLLITSSAYLLAKATLFHEALHLVLVLDGITITTHSYNRRKTVKEKEKLPLGLKHHQWYVHPSLGTTVGDNRLKKIELVCQK